MAIARETSLLDSAQSLVRIYVTFMCFIFTDMTSVFDFNCVPISYTGLLGCASAILGVRTTMFYSFVGYLWLLLFFGGCCLPAASGIIVSIVPHKFRTVSSSFSLMTFNIFGYFLSLCVSGYIMEVR